MKPHTRALIFAFIRQIRGMLAAVEIFMAEDEKQTAVNPEKTENNQKSVLPKK